jgi:hypothetical protein
MAFKNQFNLRLSCKKISSGKCQVKFQVKMASDAYYGYFLTRPEEKLKDVMHRLNGQLSMLKSSRDPFHTHLYSIGKHGGNTKDIVIFRSKAS